MKRKTLSRAAAVAALLFGFAAAAYAQNFIFRTEVTGSTGDPGVLMTLVSGSGLGMQLDAAGAEPGASLPGETRVLTYRNEVSRTITVNSVSVSPNETNFEILSQDCTGALAVGGQCSVTVRFRAAADGSYSGTLTIEAS